MREYIYVLILTPIQVTLHVFVFKNITTFSFAIKFLILPHPVYAPFESGNLVNGGNPILTYCEKAVFVEKS